MEGNVSEESLLARNLSKGVILDEYVIKFFRENDLGRFASLAEFSNEVVKELENILFLLDSNETDLIEVVLKLQDELRYFQLIDFVDNFDNKDLQKLLDEISLWLKKKEKLLAEIELLSNNEKKLEEQSLSVKNNAEKRSSIENKKRKIKIDIRRIISKVLDTITELQNEKIKDIGIDVIVKIIRENDKYKDLENKNRVFLSHAFVDKLYTLGLFLYFYDQNVYLYVDWMHQPKNSKTKKLKDNLIQEIKKSDQLLFLRTLNSELALQGGKRQIREWCAWEIGTFDYKTNGLDESRFYIDRFRQNKQSKSRSQLIQDFQPLVGIKNGSLY
ncbi:hypothetical protein [Streptococcus mitis]|uniref:hypothetical protein n=1 Tax=Streptococcus mitis TaxID=28037 RepID=UPI00098B780B|nr:hypothetical protein [Streptococcus mitis]